MKSLIFFAVICACAAFPHPFIQDTPAVQAERQRHMQLYAKAAQAAAAAPDTNVYTSGQSHSQYHHGSQPQAYQSYNHNAHRFSAPQQQYTPKWTGPLASKVPAGLPGSVAQVANTPEVDAAIANFQRAYDSAAQASRSATPHHNAYQHGQYRQPHQQTHHQGHYNQVAHTQPRWTGPMAATIPAGLPGSVHQVAATPEVQAARAQFGQVYQNQLMSVLG